MTAKDDGVYQPSQGFAFTYPVGEGVTVNQNILTATAALAAHLEDMSLTARTKSHITVSHAKRQIEMTLQVDRLPTHQQVIADMPVAAFVKVQCPHCDALIVGGPQLGGPSGK